MNGLSYWEAICNMEPVPQYAAHLPVAELGGFLYF